MLAWCNALIGQQTQYMNKGSGRFTIAASWEQALRLAREKQTSATKRAAQAYMSFCVRTLLKFGVNFNIQCVESRKRCVLDAETADLVDGCRDLFDDSCKATQIAQQGQTLREIPPDTGVAQLVGCQLCLPATFTCSTIVLLCALNVAVCTCAS